MKAQAIHARVIDTNTTRKPAASLPEGYPALASGLLAQARGLELLAIAAATLVAARVAVAIFRRT
ncbi:MAG: hypothetical protein EHM68_06340 [Lysobacterales bacterium]|nr:MAG: hypothetical protein EHM68_06340 [Xanthomonadales bacterium]